MTERLDSVGGISLLSEPPICEICDRYVKGVSAAGIGPGPLCCKDCFLAWFDGCSTKGTVKAYVMEEHGALGGEAVEWPSDELTRLRKKTSIQEKIIQKLADRLRKIESTLQGITGHVD